MEHRSIGSISQFCRYKREFTLGMKKQTGYEGPSARSLSFRIRLHYRIEQVIAVADDDDDDDDENEENSVAISSLKQKISSISGNKREHDGVSRQK